MRRTYLLGFGLLVGFLATNTLAAEPAPPAPAKPDPQELVIGDGYEVSTKLREERHGDDKPIEGVLVKVTDDWIVLGVVVTCSDEVFRSPLLNYFVGAVEEDTMLLEDYPLFAKLLKNELFMKRVVRYSKSYYWIPRETVKIVKRESAVYPSVKKDFQGDEPALKPDGGAYFELVRLADDNTTRDCGHAVTVEGGGVFVTHKISEGCLVGLSIVSELPVIGRFLTIDQTTTRDVNGEKYPLASVEYIWQHVPYKDRAKRHADGKQAAN
jgi:hypothetical protein